jgi:DNA-binding NtrC family response regulator
MDTLENGTSSAVERAMVALVADSSERDRPFLTNALHDADRNIRVIEAADGPTAIRLLTEHRADVVFLDRQLPGLDPVELMKWVMISGGDSTFILVSDRLFANWSQLAAAIRAYDVLIRPFDPTHIPKLLDAVRTLRHPFDAILVESQEGMRDSFHDIAGQSRFNIRWTDATSGMHALKISGLHKFRVAFINESLGDVNGLELAVRLQKVSPETKTVLYGSRNPGIKSLSQFGIAGYLRTPLRLTDFDGGVHEALGLWRPYLLNALRQTAA